MENALLIGLSRQVALSRELDAVANNVANLNTTGFKADGTLFEQYLMPVAQGDGANPSDRRLSFVRDRSTWHDLSAGPIEQTGNPLDVAINGKAFLAVQTAAGERYTRNGSLLINGSGELVTSDGDRVLGDGGPIVFQPGDNGISIDSDGTIRVREGSSAVADAERGKLRLVSFDQTSRLQKQGSSLFLAPSDMQPQPDTNSKVVQGAIEKSNVRGVVEMTRMIEITRAYSQIAALLQQQADLQRTSIEKLADVPA